MESTRSRIIYVHIHIDKKISLEANSIRRRLKSNDYDKTARKDERSPLDISEKHSRISVLLVRDYW